MTSEFLVCGPIDTLMAEAAVISSYPIAFKTRLDLTLPLEQAEPAEIANPAKSICIT